YGSHSACLRRSGVIASRLMGPLHCQAISLCRIGFFALTIVTGACDSVVADAPAAPSFHEDQILDARTAQPVSWNDFLNTLAVQDVIYIGEEHENRWHVEAAVKILDALPAKHRQPILALEMFSWDGQAGLDRYVSRQELSRDDFLRESHWGQNWGGGFE